MGSTVTRGADRIAVDGLAIGTCALYDLDGPIGWSSARSPTTSRRLGAGDDDLVVARSEGESADLERVHCGVRRFRRAALEDVDAARTNKAPTPPNFHGGRTATAA